MTYGHVIAVDVSAFWPPFGIFDFAITLRAWHQVTHSQRVRPRGCSVEMKISQQACEAIAHRNWWSLGLKHVLMAKRRLFA